MKPSTLVVIASIASILFAACGGPTPSDSALRSNDSSSVVAPAASSSKRISSPLPEGPKEFTPWCGATPCPCIDSPSPTEKDGQLVSCILAKSFSIQDVPCRSGGSPVKFGDDGRLKACTSEGKALVQGFPVAEGSALSFYPHGGIHTIWQLSETIEVDGLPCSGRLSFAWKGDFMSCLLGESWKSGDLKVPAGDWVKIQQGALYRWEIGSTARIGEVQCRDNAFFYPDGALKRCELAGEQTLDETVFESGSAVCFAAEGVILDCEGVTVNWGA